MSSPSLARLADAYHYLHYADRIEGWLYQTTALAMMELLWLQEAARLSGDIAEIGVHHGCSLLALVAAARPGDTIVAIDIFDRQDLNIDDSGKGNLATFRRHLAYLFPQARVEIVAKSSFEVRGAERENGLAGIRFLSIDGSHTKAATLNDLAIADACLAPHGVVCVDDLLNARWTGVVSALFAFLDAKPDLVPFALFPNKLFLCRAAFRQRYLDGCRIAFEPATERRDNEFGAHLIDVYGDRWPELTPRLAAPAVAAAAADRIRALNASDIPVMRPWIVAPGDIAATTARIEHLERQLDRERRRAEAAERRAADLAARPALLRWLRQR